ncbi:hypothetical protein C8F04DRAFT_1132760 [Mycena alexandri]|uniref:Uncharacterized protein n=1 Tax=Mycena alexandri TaxID=1745969 RepID=A0AAD6SA52_9AGAR|nr:hypothetical protein C8F04DRAFT_1132760 [Mycena alexandri]
MGMDDYMRPPRTMRRPHGTSVALTRTHTLHPTGVENESALRAAADLQDVGCTRCCTHGHPTPNPTSHPNHPIRKRNRIGRTKDETYLRRLPNMRERRQRTPPPVPLLLLHLLGGGGVPVVPSATIVLLSTHSRGDDCAGTGTSKLLLTAKLMQRRISPERRSAVGNGGVDPLYASAREELILNLCWAVV